MEHQQPVLANKVIFRFIFLLFTGFILLFNNGGYLLYTAFQYMVLYPAIEQPVVWIGKHIFQIPVDFKIMNNGSGDTIFDNVLLILLVIVSIIGTLIWSLAAKKDASYERLHDILRIAVRYYIGGMMIMYGIDKLFKTQFPYPDLFYLTTPLGDLTPKSLAWSFLGQSYLYNVFMGIAELSCTLLLFRRTVSLGAVIAFMVSINVMVVNYSFDVPVKMVSTALVLMSVFLMSNDLTKYFKLFFKAENISLKPAYVPVYTGKWKKIRIVIKSIFIISTLGIVIFEDYSYKGELAKKHVMQGYYTIDSLSSSNEHPFDKIIINNTQSVRVLKDEEMQHFSMKEDTSKQTFYLITRAVNDTAYSFNYQFDTSGILVLKMDDQQWTYHRKYNNAAAFKLNQQPFEWISESPRSY